MLGNPITKIQNSLPGGVDGSEVNKNFGFVLFGVDVVSDSKFFAGDGDIISQLKFVLFSTKQVQEVSR
jgi:hypothetical protein